MPSISKTVSTVAGRSLAALAVSLGLVGAGAGSARAETTELRIGSGFGIHYLPFYVMQHERLVEKHAKELGLPEIKVSYAILSGGAALNDAILSGSADFAGAGVGPFAVMWDKTRGNLNVRAVAAMGDIPLVLLTNDARIKSLEDIREGDRVALPAVRASMQATLLQMAAAKIHGEAKYKSFDASTVSMTHSDATTALLSNSGVVNMHFSVAPYSTRALANPSVRQISDVAAIVGGPMSFNLVFCTEKFQAANPTVAKAFTAALAEAMEVIRSNRPLAAKIYFEGNKGAATDVKMVEDILADPTFNYTVDPHGVGKFVGFMQSTGIVKNKPASWKDLFFPIAHGLDGN